MTGLVYFVPDTNACNAESNGIWYPVCGLPRRLSATRGELCLSYTCLVAKSVVHAMLAMLAKFLGPCKISVFLPEEVSIKFQGTMLITCVYHGPVGL